MRPRKAELLVYNTGGILRGLLFCDCFLKASALKFLSQNYVKQTIMLCNICTGDHNILQFYAA